MSWVHSSPSISDAQLSLWGVFCQTELLSFPGICANPGGVLVLKTSDSGLRFQNSYAEEILCVSDCVCTRAQFCGLQCVFAGARFCSVCICTMVKQWMECGRVRTHFLEVFPSC